MNGDPNDPDKTLPRTPAGSDAATVTPAGQTPPSNSANKPLESTLVYASANQLSLPLEDLSSDKLLIGCRRVTFDGRSVPSLGGIPLLAKLGQGGMGAVYFGIKLMLKQEVAVKVLPMQLAQQQPELVARFLREAQIAAKVESPHLVRVSDVNEDAGLYYFVMEYVAGTSAGSFLKKATQAGQQGLDEGMALDICIAATIGLSAAHEQGIIHRDVKPDNILLPKAKSGDALLFTAGKLADLGLARSEESGQSLTGNNAAMGTPGYMAPEQALNAKKAGKTADVFSMGATLYALLTGRAPFKGETATETVLATIQKPHVPVAELRPSVNKTTADLLERCLAKEPSQRFADAAALLKALQTCRGSLGAPDTQQMQALQTLTALQKLPETGQAVQVPPSSHPPASQPPAPGTPTPATFAQTVVAPVQPKGMPLGVIAAIVILCIGLAIGWKVVSGSSDQRYAAAITEGEEALDNQDWDAAEAAFARALKERPSDGVALKGHADAKHKHGATAHAETVEFGIAFSTEKEDWIREAAKKFNAGDSGRQRAVKLIPMGPQQAVEALISGDERIHLWTPASSLYKDMFVKEWRKGGDNDPIVREEKLALTPMVFFMFEDRYQAFIQKYKALNFDTIGQAMQEKDGWASIAQKPDWGRFSFAISNPLQHNTGLATMALMASHFHKNDLDLSVEEVKAPPFLLWARRFERAMNLSGMPSQVMRDMILKGPSAYDGLIAYESLAVDNLKTAEGRWGPCRLVYPDTNIWNDHPCYLLDAPWVSEAQKKAANEFVDFLMTEEMQKGLLAHGFRPGNPRVAIKTPDSPFAQMEKSGLKIDVPIVVNMPKAEVVDALLDTAHLLLEKPGGPPRVKPAWSDRLKKLQEDRKRN